MPESYPTIQRAIDEAVDGDTVLIGPGIYSEGLSISDQMITLRSTHGPDMTMVDGGNSRALTIMGDVGPRTLIEGLTFVVSGNLGFDPFGWQTLILNGACPTLRGNVYPMQDDENSFAAIGSSGAVSERCIFRGGLALEKVLVSSLSSGQFTNCLFDGNAGNDTISYGGLSSVELWGCTLANNSSTNLIRHFDATGQIVGANTIIFGNSAGTEFNGLDPNLVFESSIFTGGSGSNADADPQFVDLAGGDYRLSGDSPAIDAGDCSLVPERGLLRDLDGAPRLRDASLIPDTGPLCDAFGPIDLGCYEAPLSVMPTCIGDANGDDMVDFGDITSVLGAWLSVCP